MPQLPITTRWFVTEPADDQVIRITEPHLHALVAANLWWIRGAARDVVIDTGLGVASLRRHLPDLFAHDPLALITHTHLDHVGGAHEFREVGVHASEADALRHPAPASLYTTTELDLLGIDVTGFTFPELLLDAVPVDDFELAAYGVRPVLTPPRRLHEGDLIDLGDRTLRALHAPGHSPGSMILLDETARVLYAGDVIYEGGLLDEMHGADIPAYVATMRRLLDLEVAEVRAGHGDPFGGARMREIAADYIRYRA
ncbi:MBL fold metallo-hydrolase [Sphaerisporangium sp. NPDC051017]|uniref:MBL fold metallo-hydrolase n=1 Tax=Sphaerisporangium sp. NPDC051017 TaxID=3154636 RepID=UPI003419ABD5